MPLLHVFCLCWAVSFLLLAGSTQARQIEYCEGALTQGKLAIDVKYFGMHIYQETRDLCKETSSCPISTGDFVLLHEEILPSFTPPGSYTLNMKILGEEDKLLTCFNFDFSIGFMSSVASS
ncbi:phosphatidylglycerol/phosphatidylinositol transfer protein-like isoform X2 [Canna indica]|uniref:Phosphatidylglycerol/phosphatidylinositol transfer protein-like isoform X2 n=1 Tax=Canna indica TaxID=4628 RepID=A0AAQ3QFG1_9LILI|nr:phosphatidylglycerol/phosphatidylinositol transfer protein-like isoform X2 [Canna indica]